MCSVWATSSPPVSPSVVAAIFRTQNSTVTWGSFFTKWNLMVTKGTKYEELQRINRCGITLARSRNPCHAAVLDHDVREPEVRHVRPSSDLQRSQRHRCRCAAHAGARPADR